MVADALVSPVEHLDYQRIVDQRRDQLRLPDEGCSDRFLDSSVGLGPFWLSVC